MEGLDSSRSLTVEAAALDGQQLRGILSRAQIWFRGTTSRARVCAALTIAALAIAALPSLGVRPPAFSVADGGGNSGPTISAVGVGTDAWANGFRAGLPGTWQALDGVAQHTFVVQPAGGVAAQVALPVIPITPSAAGLIAGGLAAVLALALTMLRLPGGPALLGLATGIALMSLDAQVGLPQALPLTLLPGVVALLAVHVAHRGRQRLFDLAALAFLVLLAGFGLVASGGNTAVDWRLLWITPAVMGLAIGLAGDALAIATRLSSLPAGAQRRLAFAAVPLAAESRLQGADEERSRLAIELHNEVLPRVETSLRDLRSGGSVDAAANTLQTLAGDLRESMEQRQTVLLETAGVAAALRNQFEARPGPHITFFVRGASFRPKARVELAAFRIGQAAIDNAVRHSSADQISVSISSAKDLFDMTIDDDGVGLDPDAENNARRRGRIGLAQMRLRAESVGATLDMRGRPDTGTSVVFHWSA